MIQRWHSLHLLGFAFVFFGFVLVGKAADLSAPIAVACVGDSLTAEGSHGRPPAGMAYPDQLQGLLGPTYKVDNFGHGGGTVLKKGDFPYWKKKEYPQALASKPNIVIIMLGTNDSKPQNWVYGDEYVTDYRDLIKSFQALDTHPHIYLCRIPTVVEPNKYKISETVSVIIRQRIDDLGKELGLTVIPMDQAYGGDLSVLGDDHVHGDARGARELAQTVAKVLQTPVATTRPQTLTTTVTDVATLPVSISPIDSKILYLGRFDSSKGDPRCSWTASTLALKFEGTDLNAQLEDSGQNYWEIEIDGRPIQKMALGTGSHLYKIASGLVSGSHVLRLVRVTESLYGPTQIHGFQINAGGTLLPLAAPAHRLEVIGDSITCGYGNEGLPGNANPPNTIENGYLSYGEVAARKLELDYHCIAWSGRKMWPDKTMPSIYDKIIPTEDGKTWDFSQWIPDAILINLSTNDFNRNPLDEAAWTVAYEQFIGVLRTHFPQSIIYCATSPMLRGDRLNSSKAYLQKIVTDLNTAGDSKIKYFEFESQDPKDGIGGSRHPNVKTDQMMGDKLASQLVKDMGWTAAPTYF